MTTHMYEYKGSLLTLTRNSILSVYSISDFNNCSSLNNNNLPKIQSPLGITMRSPISSFDLSSIVEVNSTIGSLYRGGSNQHALIDSLFIYDSKTLLILDLNYLTHQQSPQIKVINKLKLNEIKGFQKSSTISTLVIVQSQTQGEQKPTKQILLSTIQGNIHLLKLTKQLKNIQLQSSFNISEITSNQLNNKIIQQKYQSLHLKYNSQEQSEYATYITVNQNQIYLSTNKGELLQFKRQTLQFLNRFDRQSLSLSNNNNINTAKPNSTKDKPLPKDDKPIKIIFARNSILVLHKKYLIQYNIHTKLVINILTLPTVTLDIILQQNLNNYQSKLLMVGEINSLYSIEYPFLNNLKLKKSNISSRLARSILSTQSSFVFVAGNDSTIDVFKGDMLFMVLVQEHTNMSKNISKNK